MPSIVWRSAFRGMWINEDLRGNGLSKIFLAIWLRVCLVAGFSPHTHRIDKPLLSLVLHRFGFVPTSRACELEVSSGGPEDGGRLHLWSPHGKDLQGVFSKRTLRDQHLVIATTRPDGCSNTVSVLTDFEGPCDRTQLEAQVVATLGESFVIVATTSALHRAFCVKLFETTQEPGLPKRPRHSSTTRSD
jgi:hypothetical protein